MTTVHSRYQVVDCTLGELVLFETRREVACSQAVLYANRNPGHVVEVFDLMARRGSTDTWQLDESGKFTAVHVRD